MITIVRSWRTAVLVTCVVGALLAMAPARSAPPDAPWTGWGGTTDDPLAAGTVVDDGTGFGPAIFEYDNGYDPDLDPPNDGDDGLWEFTTDAAVDDFIRIDWTYTGFHGANGVTVGLELIGDGFEVAETLVAEGPVECCVEPADGFSYAGTEFFFVGADEMYGFRMTGSNAGSDSSLRGRLEIDTAQAGVAEIDTYTSTGGEFPEFTIAGHVTGHPGSAQRVEIRDAGDCIDGELIGGAFFDEFPVAIDDSGVGAFLGFYDYFEAPNTFITVRASRGLSEVETATGPVSMCAEVAVEGDPDPGVVTLELVEFTPSDTVAFVSAFVEGDSGSDVRLDLYTDDDCFEDVLGGEGGGTLVGSLDIILDDFGEYTLDEEFEVADDLALYAAVQPSVTFTPEGDEIPTTLYGPMSNCVFVDDPSLPPDPGVVTLDGATYNAGDEFMGATGLVEGDPFQDTTVSFFTADFCFEGSLGGEWGGRFIGSIDIVLNEVGEYTLDDLFALADVPEAFVAAQTSIMVDSGEFIEIVEGPESACVEVSGSPPDSGGAGLLQVVPIGDDVFVSGVAFGPPNSDQQIEIFTDDVCEGGEVTEGARFLGAEEVAVGPDGVGYFQTTFTPLDPVGFFAVVFNNSAGAPPEDCVVVGPGNTSWLTAARIPLTDVGGDVFTGGANGFVDAPGAARWYKVAITPGAKLTVTLDDLPADFDLALFTDIAAEFERLNDPQDVDALHRLGAEYAPSAFAPSAFAPSAFAPSAFAPSAFAPSAFAPSAFAPSVFAPSAFAPSAFAPSAFAPSAFAPSAFAPSAFAPSAFAPSAFAPSAFAPSAFAAGSFTSAQTASLITISAELGQTSETVVADTWNNTGDFYIRVQGKNGASSLDAPFRVDATLDGAVCQGVLAEPSDQVSPLATAGQFRSIILWDPARMDPAISGNSPAEIDALRARLDLLASRPEVAGVVIDLSADPRVQAFHAQADLATSCPYAANLVAGAIKDVVDAHRAVNPLEYVVLAGSDVQLPFFRYPDQALLGPESDYDPPVSDDTHSQSALRLNYILGQDEYGATTTLSLQEGQFPVPDLAVGRLVETAADMFAVLDAYMGTPNGVLPTPTDTLVTGYDFLTDVALAIQEEFTEGLGFAGDQLITPAELSPQDPASWNADQLREQLLGKRHDLMFLAGHFSANSALAADYQTSVLSTELAASDVDLTNAVVFSNGCHSGYNIADDDTVANVSEPRDWSQVFAQKGATLIAGTGYQYGDTDFIEYNERIYLQFTQELRKGTGPVSVGQALVRAKQRYLSGVSDLRGLDRKSVLIGTIYGLPFLSYDLPGRTTSDDDTSIIGATESFTTDPGNTLGLSYADITIAEQLTPKTKELKDLDGNTVTATYFEGPDGVVTKPAEPILPLVRKNIDVPIAAMRGAGFRGGAWNEQTVVPLTGAPATEIRGVHIPFDSPVDFPMTLGRANYFGNITGTGGTTFNVTPVQHRGLGAGTSEAVARVFDSLDFRLFYSGNTESFDGNVPALAAAPSISNVAHQIDGDDVIFSATVIGDPSAGIQEVWIVHTDGAQSSGVWEPLDLVQDPNVSSRWSGRLVDARGSFDRLDYLIGAANGVGLVSIDDNYGAYYRIFGLGSLPQPPQPEPTTLQLSASNPSTASFGSTRSFSATLLSDGDPVAAAPVRFTVGGTTRVGTTDATGLATVSLPLNGTPGVGLTRASFGGLDGLHPSAAQAPFELLKAVTVIDLQAGPATTGPTGTASGIIANLRDGSGSPLVERTVFFTIADAPGGPITRAVITDFLGRASLGTVDLPQGAYPVTARFLGTVDLPSGPLTRTSRTHLGTSAQTTLHIDPDQPAIFVSASGAGRLGTERYQDEDILGYDTSNGTFSLVFDGSDVELRRDLDAFVFLDDGSILLSYGAPFYDKRHGLGFVDDSDILRFVPTSLGIDTDGTAELFFDGSDFGLTTAAEDIDALAVTLDGRLVISTVGNAFAGNTAARGQDLLVLEDDPTVTPTGTPDWSIYFDGSDVGLQKNSERIRGASIGPATALSLTTRGRYNTPGAFGTGDDVMTCLDFAAAPASSCILDVVFRERVGGYVDGVHVGPPATAGWAIP